MVLFVRLNQSELGNRLSDRLRFNRSRKPRGRRLTAKFTNRLVKMVGGCLQVRMNGNPRVNSFQRTQAADISHQLRFNFSLFLNFGNRLAG